jgi:hypothetical protein
MKHISSKKIIVFCVAFLSFISALITIYLFFIGGDNKTKDDNLENSTPTININIENNNTNNNLINNDNTQTDNSNGNEFPQNDIGSDGATSLTDTTSPNTTPPPDTTLPTETTLSPEPTLSPITTPIPTTTPTPIIEEPLLIYNISVSIVRLDTFDIDLSRNYRATITTTFDAVEMTIEGISPSGHSYPLKLNDSDKNGRVWSKTINFNESGEWIINAVAKTTDGIEVIDSIVAQITSMLWE